MPRKQHNLKFNMKKKQFYEDPWCEAIEAKTETVICGSADPQFNGFNPENDWDA